MKFKKPSLKGNSKGFTLVEMVIVMSLIGILAALASPSISAYMARSDSREAAGSLAGYLRGARDLAMSRGQAIIVRVMSADRYHSGRIVLYRSTDANARRSCAGLDQATVDDRTTGLTEIDEFYLREVSSRTKIAGSQAEVDGSTKTGEETRAFCFLPDGRAMRVGMSGGAGASVCDGNAMRILLTAHDWAESGSNNELEDLADCNDGRDATAIKRDMSRFVVVNVPFNGAVSADH